MRGASADSISFSQPGRSDFVPDPSWNPQLEIEKWKGLSRADSTPALTKEEIDRRASRLIDDGFRMRGSSPVEERKLFRQAIDLGPSNSVCARAYVAMGRTKWDPRKLPEAAEECFDAALRLDPSYSTRMKVAIRKGQLYLSNAKANHRNGVTIKASQQLVHLRSILEDADRTLADSRLFDEGSDRAREQWGKYRKLIDDIKNDPFLNA